MSLYNEVRSNRRLCSETKVIRVFTTCTVDTEIYNSSWLFDKFSAGLVQKTSLTLSEMTSLLTQCSFFIELEATNVRIIPSCCNNYAVKDYRSLLLGHPVSRWFAIGYKNINQLFRVIIWYELMFSCSFCSR